MRCLVCQNQSIDDSDADLARDLRLLVRDRLKSGDTDAAVKDYLVDRYGEYVLLNPRFNLGNALLFFIEQGDDLGSRQPLDSEEVAVGEGARVGHERGL